MTYKRYSTEENEYVKNTLKNRMCERENGKYLLFRNIIKFLIIENGSFELTEHNGIEFEIPKNINDRIIKNIGESVWLSNFIVMNYNSQSDVAAKWAIHYCSADTMPKENFKYENLLRWARFWDIPIKNASKFVPAKCLVEIA